MDDLSFAKSSEYVTVNRTSLEKLVTLVEELVINKIRIEKVKNEIDDKIHTKILDQEIEITSQVQDTVKKMLMVKMKNIYATVADLVSSYNKQYNQNVELILQGQEVEIESSSVNIILDVFNYSIKDIFSNEFETDTEKVYQIKVSTASDNKNISICIESTGNGFDYEYACNRLGRKSLDLTSMNESEILMLSSVVNPNIDSSEILKLSEDIVSLGGDLTLKAEKDTFKQINAIIPVSSSIIQALLVKVAGSIYAIPLEFIETTINRSAVSIKSSNNTNVIVYMEHVIKLINVSETLGITSDNTESCILIIKANGRIAALLVDSLLDQTDIVIKPKPNVIKNIKEYKGTTILGDGLVTLVLDVASIIK